MIDGKHANVRMRWQRRDHSDVTPVSVVGTKSFEFRLLDTVNLPPLIPLFSSDTSPPEYLIQYAGLSSYVYKRSDTPPSECLIQFDLV